jgi:hypothetical protein
VQHHLEVQRLVTLADVLVWVLDPQKYADAAIHDRFLRPLASHSEVMMVVLNHADEIPAGGLDACMGDVRRLLASDGLGGVPVIATSATRGDGLDALRRALVSRVSKKKQARDRIAADVSAVARRLDEATGSGQLADLRGRVHDDLQHACVQAAGVPVVVDAIRSATLLRATRATGWPVTSWLSRVRRDPLRRLGLGADTDAADAHVVQGARREAIQGRMPEPETVSRARFDAAVRGVSDSVTVGMAAPWRNAIRSASTSRVGELTSALNTAVARTDLGVSSDPWWWRVARVLQWLLFATAIVGVLWLAALAGLSYLRLGVPDTYDVRGIPLPTVLLVAGIVLGVVVALVCQRLAQISARRRARRAGERLRASIAEVSDSLVLRPIQAEIDAYTECRRGLDAALKR